MKTHNNLYEKIVSFANLLSAAKKAQKDKRMQPNVATFNLNLEKELIKIQESLLNQTYEPSPYNTFYVYEPKPRMISAAPYADRVVHHALCNIIAPILENSMIYDTYANRKGKGTHKAILRYQGYCRQNKYVLKCDIRKFFPSIDHEILKAEIRKKISCKPTLLLIDKLIDNSNLQEESIAYFEKDDLFTPFERRRGLPIGNLTSQLWGNYYLNALDHFIKEKLGCKGYVRYVDDFVILGDNKLHLHRIKKEIGNFLQKYRMCLHPQKTRIYATKEGIDFLGHRIFPYYRLLLKENVKLFKKRLKKMVKKYQNDLLPFAKMEEKIQSWCAHANFSCTFLLKSKIFSELALQGIYLTKVHDLSRRLLEQQ